MIGAETLHAPLTQETPKPAQGGGVGGVQAEQLLSA